MINLIEVSQKLSEILNGTYVVSPETLEKRPNYQFLVKTVGVSVDSIADKETGENFIPVFIDTMDGEISPIPDLQETNVTIPITLFFPITEKDNFFTLAEYLADILVGKVINYGKHSGRCLSNMSTAQYGEIQNIDINQFKELIRTNYLREIQVNGTFMSMTFNLYLTGFNADKTFYFGNEVALSLKYTNEGGNSFTIVPTFVDTAIAANVGTVVEQILNEESQSSSLPANAAYSVPLEIFVTNNAFFNVMLREYAAGNICGIKLDLLVFMPFTGQFTIHSMILNAALNIKKGKPITFSFNLVRTKEVE